MSKRKPAPAPPPATEQVRVTWDGGIKRWTITYPVPGSRPDKHWTTRKRDAIAWARDWIKRGGVPAELTVHEKNGQFQYGRTYFRRDARSPG